EELPRQGPRVQEPVAEEHQAEEDREVDGGEEHRPQNSRAGGRTPSALERRTSARSVLGSNDATGRRSVRDDRVVASSRVRTKGGAAGVARGTRGRGRSWPARARAGTTRRLRQAGRGVGAGRRGPSGTGGTRPGPVPGRRRARARPGGRRP